MHGLNQQGSRNDYKNINSFTSHPNAFQGNRFNQNQNFYRNNNQNMYRNTNKNNPGRNFNQNSNINRNFNLNSNLNQGQNYNQGRIIIKILISNKDQIIM